MMMSLLRMAMLRRSTASIGVQSTTSLPHHRQSQVRAFTFTFFASLRLNLPTPTEANPFAKKPSGAADGPRNPFARENPNNKSLHKSESFFDKAEAAETGKWKGLSPLS